jgi:hypothetical protein
MEYAAEAGFKAPKNTLTSPIGVIAEKLSHSDLLNEFNDESKAFDIKFSDPIAKSDKKDKLE